MLHDDNVTQSETALTNQLIAVVNSVGNEAFVKARRRRSQTDIYVYFRFRVVLKASLHLSQRVPNYPRFFCRIFGEQKYRCKISKKEMFGPGIVIIRIIYKYKKII